MFYKQTTVILKKINDHYDGLFEFHSSKISDIKKYLDESSLIYNEMTRWFNDMFPEKEVHDYVFSLIAMCVLDKNTHTVPVLYGSGSNGKTEFLRFIKSVIDPYFNNVKIYFNTSKFNYYISASFEYHNGRVFHECDCSERVNIDNFGKSAKKRIKAIPCNALFNDRHFPNKCKKYKICFLIFLLKYCINVINVKYLNVPSSVNETTKIVFGL